MVESAQEGRGRGGCSKEREEREERKKVANEKLTQSIYKARW